MSAVKFTTAEEWVSYYQDRAECLSYDRKRADLRAHLCQYAEESINKSILELNERKQYGLAIAGSAIISSIPIPGSHVLSKKIISDSAVVAYARKVLTLLGLADASAVGKVLKVAIAVCD